MRKVAVNYCPWQPQNGDKQLKNWLQVTTEWCQTEAQAKGECAVNTLIMTQRG